MRYLVSFLACGTFSLLASIIYDKSKLSIGHITSIFVLLGAVLGFFGIYDYISTFGYGFNLPITSFGNALYNAAYDDYKMHGALGVLTGVFQTTSGGISASIIFAFLISVIFKPKD